MNYRYSLDKSSRKFVCPDCRKKRLVKFVDNEGDYLPSEFGRCDRIVKCGYFKKPSSDDDSASLPVTIPPKAPSPPSHIEKEIFEASLDGYERNNLFQFLIKSYDVSTVESTFLKYNVGTANYWPGSTVFWQMDVNGKLRSGKVMQYDVANGKRIKNPKPLITWVHSILKINDFNLYQVLFGEHLILESNEDDVICLVESEKTAIICAIECPQFIWVATGSVQMFKSESMYSLKDRKIIVFPDMDSHEIWAKKADEISLELKTKIYVSDFMLNAAICVNRNKGLDLADILIDKGVNPVQISTEIQQVLNKMVEKNPAVKHLIEKFDLDTDGARLKKNEETD